MFGTLGRNHGRFVFPTPREGIRGKRGDFLCRTLVGGFTGKIWWTRKDKAFGGLANFGFMCCNQSGGKRGVLVNTVFRLFIGIVLVFTDNLLVELVKLDRVIV